MAKRKAKGGSKKGAPFERLLARTLTDWWTGDPDADCIFWRTSTSGARATSRSRKNKKVAKSHCGDLCAIDPIGQPFLDFCAVEIKRGYNKFTFADVLDKPPKGALQLFEKWVLQAEESKKQAGSKHWLIISKRDQRLPIVCMPYDMVNELWADGTSSIVSPWVDITFGRGSDIINVIAITLSAFLTSTTPEDIRKCLL